MSNELELSLMANKLRVESLKSTTAAGSGHPTTCMSCAEIMSCLFFSEMQQDDEFVLSKGHAAPILWAAYAEAGVIDRKDLVNLRKITSSLEGHPTPPLVKVATGSLGQGLSAGAGMALAKKMRNSGRVYVLLGDGECAEGSVWEAANLAAHYQLNNLCAIIDVNRLGQSQATMHSHDIDAYDCKFRAFGWETYKVNGHSIHEIKTALDVARNSPKPFAIIAKTFKGKGVSFLEDKEGWHGKALNKEQLDKAVQEIGEIDVELDSRFALVKPEWKVSDFLLNQYDMNEMVSTRDAFGRALVKLGEKNENVIVLDGDVKNSTMTQYFFEKYPNRSFECFIAEQNMTGIAVGLSASGYIPFTATFSTFWTRAHDFIRMAGYSKANVKFIGSHAGVSIGEDGPSQMGLEDIPMFLSMPESLIMYPCDAVSAENCVKEMAKHKGISYLRTTREKTPVIYDNKEKFPAGKFKILRKSAKDKALVIAAGVTVFEALKAHDMLKKKKINVRVIDLYSVKPVDEKLLVKNAKECRNNVIVVEDHYFGAIGAVVSEIIGKVKHLYIKKTPRSGTPVQLRKKYAIDASAIVKAVKK
jgi:transketolase